jgi:hypothetical protein
MLKQPSIILAVAFAVALPLANPTVVAADSTAPANKTDKPVAPSTQKLSPMPTTKPSATPAPTVPSLSLVCKIGGANGMASFDGPTGLANITFEKSKGSAASGLQPGQCAFADRAINASEPTSLVVQVGLAFGLMNFGKGGWQMNNPRASGPGAGVVNSLFSPGSTSMKFTVHVASGVFQVDKYGE